MGGWITSQSPLFTEPVNNAPAQENIAPVSADREIFSTSW